MALDKPDTVLRIDGNSSATVDESQFATDLTASGSFGYETSSARANLPEAGRELLVIFSSSNTGTLNGVLLYYGDTGATSYRYQVAASSGNVVFSNSTDGTIATVALPDVSASTENFTVQLCTRANPLTTGASDAYVTEIACYNQDQTSWAVYQATHSAGPTSTQNFSYGGQWNGATLSSATTATIYAVRLGRRFHSTTEAREDWVSAAGSFTSGADIDDPVFVLDAATNIGADAEFAGPQFAIGARMARSSRKRLLSPIVNMVYHDPPWHGAYQVHRDTAQTTPYFGQNTDANTPVTTDGPTTGSRAINLTTTAYFDTFEAVIDEPLRAALYDGGDWTWMAWIYVDSSGTGTRTIACVGVNAESTASNAINWRVISTGEQQVIYETGAGVNRTFTSTSAVPTDAWSHVAITYSGGTITFYLNGTSDGSSTLTALGSGDGTACYFGIGCNPLSASTSTDRFVGRISEFVIEEYDIGATGVAEADAVPNSKLASVSGHHWSFDFNAVGLRPGGMWSQRTLGANSFWMGPAYLLRRPVPPGATRARVRCLLAMQSPFSASSTMTIACATSTRRPGAKKITGDVGDLERYTTDVITNSASVRTLVTFDADLELVRDEDGFAFFWLGFLPGADDVEQETEFRVESWCIDPYDPSSKAGFLLPITEP